MAKAILVAGAALAAGSCTLGPLAATDGENTTHPAPVTMADVIGEYTLSSIAANAAYPETLLPAWTFPGRVMVLEGHLSLRGDSIAIASGRSRITMFNDTSYAARADTSHWSVRADGTIDFVTGRQFPENQGRVTQKTVRIFAGGLTSGGTVFRYDRP